MIKKTIVAVLFLSMVLGGIVAPAKKARAGIPVIDPTLIATTAANWLKSFANEVAKEWKETLLAQLKKQILDQIVNQTVQWIQGNGEPQFVTDFEGFLRGAGDRAVGGLLQEINLGEMCQPFRLRVRVNLENSYFGTTPPPFTQQSACTLSRVVDNIEGFYRDFNQGGWVGYTELLRPQNNYFGSYLMAQDEALRRQSVAVDVAGREVASNQGFLNTKRCVEWTGTDLLTGELIGPRSVNPDFNFPDPKNSPNDEGGTVDWRCTEDRITTPGQLLVGATNRAVNAGTDYILSAKTFANYAAAIIDAGLNRLIREGVDGFVGVITDRSSSGYAGYADGAVGDDVRSAGDELEGVEREEAASLRSDLQRSLTSLTQTRTTLVSASSSLITLLDSQISFQVWCDSSNAVSGASVLNRAAHPETCASYTASSTAALRAEIDGIRVEIAVLISTIDGLVDSINAALNSSGGSGYTGANASQAANLVSEAGSAVIDGVEISGNIETRLSSIQSSLNLCRTSTNPADCP